MAVPMPYLPAVLGRVWTMEMKAATCILRVAMASHILYMSAGMGLAVILHWDLKQW